MRDGLIVAADRLVTDDDCNPIDDENKLNRHGKRGLFVVTGKTGIEFSDGANDFTFDAKAITRDFLRLKRLEAVDWDAYRKALATPLRDCLKAIPFEGWPPTPRNNLVQALFPFVDTRGRFRMSRVQVIYEKRRPLEFNVRWGEAAEKDFEMANVSVFAGATVWTEVLSGSDSRFDDLRRDFDRFRSPNSVPAKDVTRDEAATFARALIQATSERAHLIGGQRDVGPTSDVVALTRDGIEDVAD
jgi:hypothetical protein